MDTESRITPDRAVLVGSLLAALAYFQDVRYDFILDDISLILLNETIASWRNWKTAFVNQIFDGKALTVPVVSAAVHYRPFYKLWQMLNEQVFGSITPWWHFTSLLLHIGVTMLVYQVGIKLVKDRWTAALAALLFAFHPIHVESVAYITASTDLLVALYTLISFLAYFRFREEGGSFVYFFVSVIAAALAMMSKETAVMFPWLLVSYEALRESRPGLQPAWKRLAWTLPFFAVVGAYIGARTLLFGLNDGPGPGGNRIKALLDIPLVLVTYLHLLVWPFRLSFFYPAEWGSQWTVLKGVEAVLAVGVAFLLWNRYRDRSGIRLQIVWTAILFVPALLGVYAFVREDWVHDRHMYLVSVPLCFIAAMLLTDSRWPAKASVIASSLVLAILLFETAIQLPRFSDDATIYATSLEVAPRNLLAHTYFARALWLYGRHEEGLREFKISTDLAPRSWGTYESYATALAEVGRNQDAIVEYNKALQWTPRPTRFRAFLLYELAAVELRCSEYPEATSHLTEAVQIAPESLNYHSLLALALTREGRIKEADEETKLEASVRQRFVQNHPDTRN
jgi:Flp pilus assembly protein TadD